MLNKVFDEERWNGTIEGRDLMTDSASTDDSNEGETDEV